MTLQTQAVLAVLLDDPSAGHYGLEISKQAKLPSGTIYPMLARLQRAGWVTSAWEDLDPQIEGRPARRLYRLTPSGAERARQAQAETVSRIAPRWGPAPRLGEAGP
jgi:PadR family transcriptional regulator PadR